MKVITVLGARPQFIKASMVSREFSKYKDVDEIIIHTGQHFDKDMSEIFFQQMGIKEPKYNLNINSLSHGAMTGRMLEEIEKILQLESPDCVLVYGDTNSTLAGALAASKIHIPVAHVEAGLRSHNMYMPEEQNRILTDHISTLLLCPTNVAVDNLFKEGLKKNIILTGDVMYDASMYYRNIEHKISLDIPSKYCLITLHRAENTDDLNRLTNIVQALNNLPNIKGVLPLHPRTLKMMQKYGLEFNKDVIKVIQPVGYLDMIYLEANSEFIITDSGGIQKEAYFFKKPCITLRDQTEWIETIEAGWNVIVGANNIKINNAICSVKKPDYYPKLYGDGNSAGLIVKALIRKMSERNKA